MFGYEPDGAVSRKSIDIGHEQLGDSDVEQAIEDGGRTVRKPPPPIPDEKQFTVPTVQTIGCIKLRIGSLCLQKDITTECSSNRGINGSSVIPQDIDPDIGAYLGFGSHGTLMAPY
jgi:hypothetical protein